MEAELRTLARLLYMNRSQHGHTDYFQLLRGGVKSAQKLMLLMPRLKATKSSKGRRKNAVASVHVGELALVRRAEALFTKAAARLSGLLAQGFFVALVLVLISSAAEMVRLLRAAHPDAFVLAPADVGCAVVRRTVPEEADKEDQGCAIVRGNQPEKPVKKRTKPEESHDDSQDADNSEDRGAAREEPKQQQQKKKKKKQEEEHAQATETPNQQQQQQQEQKQEQEQEQEQEQKPTKSKKTKKKKRKKKADDIDDIFAQS